MRSANAEELLYDVLFEITEVLNQRRHLRRSLARGVFLVLSGLSKKGIIERRPIRVRRRAMGPLH